MSKATTTKNGFIMISRDLMRTTAWQSLHPCAGWVLIDVWSRHNGKNNGKIIYTVNDAQRLVGCGRRQAIRFLHELEEKGFIVATKRGHFQIKSGSWKSRGTTWRLTMEPCNGQPPTRDYLQWSPTP